MTVKAYAHFSQWPEDQWPWPDFSPRELASKREGALKLDTAAMDRLQRLRDSLGKPILITSAYRSPAHNRAVGGARNSYHMDGMAFDVRMDNHDPVAFERAARAVGFTGFGHYVHNGFMHIDTRPSRLTFKGAVTDWPETATGWPVEPPRKPEKLRENRQAQAAIGITGVSTGVAVVEQVSREDGIIDRMQDPTVLLVLVAGVAAWLAWRSWSGR